MLLLLSVLIEILFLHIYQYIRAEDEEEIKEAVNLPAKRPYELGSHSTYARNRKQQSDEEDLEASGNKKKQTWAGRVFGKSKRASKVRVLPDGVEGVFEPMQNQGVGHGPMVSQLQLRSILAPLKLIHNGY